MPVSARTFMATSIRPRHVIGAISLMELYFHQTMESPEPPRESTDKKLYIPKHTHVVNLVETDSKR